MTVRRPHRAVTCSTAGCSDPAKRYMLGTIRSKPDHRGSCGFPCAARCATPMPWDAVNVEQREPAETAPWSAPAAPPSDCI
jgi:hypothetical protein